MTTTRVLRAHRCELPSCDNHGDIVRCDICGHYWQAWCRDGWEHAARWQRISRITGWWANRRNRKQATADQPDGDGR